MKHGAKPSRPLSFRWSVALAAAGFCAAAVAQVATPVPAPVVEAVDVAVAAAAQLPVPLEPHPAREWWVWGALCLALLLLAGMVWSLFASLRRGRRVRG